MTAIDVASLIEGLEGLSVNGSRRRRRQWLRELGSTGDRRGSAVAERIVGDEAALPGRDRVAALVCLVELEGGRAGDPPGALR